LVRGVDMDNLKSAVVERFRQLCDERNIKPNTLANLAGVTPSTVYSLFDESRNSVQLKTIKVLCDGLEITLAEFFDTKEFNELEQEIK
jgi:DNA-binding Xre family transcriptional regulator